MSGIFPNPDDGGVAPGVTNPPSYDPVNDPVGTLARYFSEQCGVRLRAEVLNAIISQILALIDFSGLAYDPAKGHVDASEAVQYYIQKNLGAYVELNDGPQHYTALGTPTFLEYKEGMVVWAKMPVGANNVSNADLSIDGLGFRAIVRPDGSAVVSDDMLSGRGVGFIFINNQWQMFTAASDFMTLARQRLPFFPIIQTANGRMGVVSPGTGQIAIPNGVAFLHRGIFLDNTDNYSAPQKNFATTAGKTYHLRWTPLGGFALKDLADVAYNPGALPETSSTFDSTYDDMLIARAVTNAGNIVTVTDLINLDRFVTSFNRTAIAISGNHNSSTVDNHTYGLARTPTLALESFNTNTTADWRDSQEQQIQASNITRYGCSVTLFTSAVLGDNNYSYPYKFNVIL